VCQESFPGCVQILARLIASHEHKHRPIPRELAEGEGRGIGQRLCHGHRHHGRFMIAFPVTATATATATASQKPRRELIGHRCFVAHGATMGLVGGQTEMPPRSPGPFSLIFHGDGLPTTSTLV